MAAKKAKKGAYKGEGTVEQIAPDRFIAYVRTKIDGKTKKVGRCVGASEREVRLKLRDWIAKGGMAEVKSPSTVVVDLVDVPTTGELLQKWFDARMNDWKPTTKATNRQNLPSMSSRILSSGIRRSLNSTTKQCLRSKMRSVGRADRATRSAT